MTISRSRLDRSTYDLLVVGGGVVGACITRAAARAGLRAALVERDDFASAASANSLKILHGGLRDLRRLDLGAVRAGAREQAAWMRLAPHLVDPLPFLLPTYRAPGQSRIALRAALGLAQLVSPGSRSARLLPGWRILSRRQALERVPELPGAVTGAALWHEGQLYSAERLVWALVRDALDAGAEAANHAEVCALLRRGDGAVAGARVRDTLTGEETEVRARCTVIATGATAPRLAADLLGAPAPEVAWSLAMNVVLPDLGYRTAFALRSRLPGGGSRQLLFVPWRGRTLLGTGHYAYAGDPSRFDRASADPAPLLAEANAAWTGPRVGGDAVLLVHAGLLPVRPGSRAAPDDLLREPVIADHAADGAPGLISVLSVRLSYARRLAARVLGCVSASLGRDAAPGGTGRIRRSADDDLKPLPGGGDFDAGGGELPRELPEDVRAHLARCYGSEAPAVVAAVRAVDGWDRRVVDGEPVIFGQFVHGVRAEMARTADDLVWRRTEIGPRGLADGASLELARAALAVADAARGPRHPGRAVPGRAGSGAPAGVADGAEGDDEPG